MGAYETYRKQRQEEFNKLPIFFAFSEKQLEEELSKRNLTMDDLDKVRRFGTALYLKADEDAIKAFCNRDTKGEIFKKISESKSFALDAFKFEMRNHEYPINYQGDWDVCSCFGDCEYTEEKTGEDYLREIGFAEHVIAIWQQARKAVMRYDY